MKERGDGAFDAGFEIEVALRLAQAAYDTANAVPLRLPDGYTKIADITLDFGRLTSHIARATPSQHKLYRAMLLEVRRPEVFGLLVRNQAGTVGIALRGTQKLEEWLKDFDFRYVPYQAVPGSGNVHEGFQIVYDSIQSSIKAAVQACGDRTRTLIAGHSLGAALSVLCAPDLAAHFPNAEPPEVHTFAGPRVAGPDDSDPAASTYAQQFKRSIPICFRIVNLWDIVPNLPPAMTFYQHVGNGVSIDGGFTFDLVRSHSVELAYGPGLERLLPRVAHRFHIAPVP
jgi:triacylglycerol lipase